MEEAYKPTPMQRKMIAGAGLNPDEWKVRMESRQYLYLGNDRQETEVIDKATGETVKKP